MVLLVLAIAWCLMLFPFCVLIGRSIAAAGATLAEAEAGAVRRAEDSVPYRGAEVLV